MPLLKYLIEFKLVGQNKPKRTYILARSRKEAFIKTLETKGVNTLASIEILGEPIPSGIKVRIPYFKKLKKG